MKGTVASLRGECGPVCNRDSGACWHRNTKIRKQLKNGKWVLENQKGYIRLANEDEIIFDEGTYTYPDILERIAINGR